MVEEEKLRLEAAINACDRLKKSLFARIEDLTRTTCETSDHTNFLKRASVNMMGRYSQDVHLSKPHPFSVSGELEYTISRIDDLYEQRVHLDRLTRSVRNSVLSVAFLETGLSPDHADDEVIIDLNKMTAPKQFDTPPSFFLASWALHDMIVDQVYRHPLPANAQETGLIQENSPTRATPSAPVVVDAKLVQNLPDINQNNVIVISKPTEVKTSVQKKVATAVTAVRAQESTAQQQSAGLTWSQVSKINCPTKASGESGQGSQVSALLPRIDRIAPETNRPHCYFDCVLPGRKNKDFRFVIRVRPDKAPAMSENFIRLCTGVKGFGYQGSRFFRCKPDDHIVLGDFEKNDGSGGRSAFEERTFLAEQCSIKDHKGAVRMRGIERTADGRCKVGSQFMVWVGDIDYKDYKFTLVFGEVTHGLKHLQEMSRIGMMYSGHETWLLKEDIVIKRCGVL